MRSTPSPLLARRAAAAALMGAAAAALAGCQSATDASGYPDLTPAEVVTTFLDAIDTGNCGDYLNTTTPEYRQALSAPDCNTFETGAERFGSLGHSIRDEAQISDTEAQIQAGISQSGATIYVAFALTRTDDAWFIYTDDGFPFEGAEPAADGAGDPPSEAFGTYSGEDAATVTITFPIGTESLTIDGETLGLSAAASEAGLVELDLAPGSYTVEPGDVGEWYTLPETEFEVEAYTDQEVRIEAEPAVALLAAADDLVAAWVQACIDQGVALPDDCGFEFPNGVVEADWRAEWTLRPLDYTLQYSSLSGELGVVQGRNVADAHFPDGQRADAWATFNPAGSVRLVDGEPVYVWAWDE